MSDKLPSKVAMGLSLLKAGAKAVSYSIQEGKLPLSPEELSKQRLAICETCPFLIRPTETNKHNRCQKCGCFLEYKTKLITESCPKGKW